MFSAIYAEYRKQAECRILFFVVLNVIVLNVVMLSVVVNQLCSTQETNKFIN